MTVELISVGTEILLGQIVNTNARFLSERLADLGIAVYRTTVVGDNRERLTAVINEALSRVDCVILSGGLGPTEDDITKETTAECMGKELELHEESFTKIKDYFAAKHMTMPEVNIKQAMFPGDAIILKNAMGTAPGCIMKNGNKTAILLPGPPDELEPMFENELVKHINSGTNTCFYSRVVRIHGMGESMVEQRLKSIIDAQTNPTIAPYAKPGEVTLRITAACADADEGERMVEPVIDEICDELGDVVYSTHDESLQEVCARLLISSNKTVAAAESCTGGMLASMLVSVAGSSAWFKEAAVTYSEEAKIKRLNVPREVLEKYGAVSFETAEAMAVGIKNTSGADIGIATTGAAGPEAAPNAPVGTVYIALADNNGVKTEKLSLRGNRERIRVYSCQNLLDMLRKSLI